MLEELRCATVSGTSMLATLCDMSSNGERCCQALLQLASFRKASSSAASAAVSASVTCAGEQQRCATAEFMAACVASMKQLLPPFPTHLQILLGSSSTGTAAAYRVPLLKLLTVRATCLAKVNHAQLLHLACLQLRQPSACSSDAAAAANSQVIQQKQLSDATSLVALRLNHDVTTTFAGWAAVFPLPSLHDLQRRPLSIALIEERSALEQLTSSIALLARQVFLSGLLVEQADPSFARQCYQHATEIADRLLGAAQPHAMALRRLLCKAGAQQQHTLNGPLLPHIFPHVDHFPACFVSGRVEMELYTL